MVVEPITSKKPPLETNEIHSLLLNKYVLFIEGPPGSGKTLFTTLLAVVGSKTFLIRANYGLNLENFIYLEVEHFFDLNPENKELIIMDEGYAWLESRNSTARLNRFLTHKLFQTRKWNTYYIVTAQEMGSIDNRFRQLAGILVESERTMRGFKYKVYHKKKKRGRWVWKRKNVWFISFEKARKLYKYFNTLEVVESESMKGLALDFRSVDEVMADAEEIRAELMKKEMKKWSRPEIESYLYKNKIAFNKNFLDSIYYEIIDFMKNEKKKKKAKKTLDKKAKKEITPKEKLFNVFNKGKK